MNKAKTIRFLQSEGFSHSEIALAVGYSEWVIRLRLERQKLLAKDRIPEAARGWRGYQIGERVWSL